MSDIFGTILSVGDFLKKDSKELKILNVNGTEKTFILSHARKYIIPDYQREIRWSKENLIELISDIGRGAKFLGNIVLNKCSADEYEIIDGQQRITTLIMIIYYIKSRFDKQLEIIKPCTLEMVNFKKFNLLLEKNFNISCFNEDELEELKKSDVFNQRERYIELWKVLESIGLLQNSSKCNSFLRNLRRSQINLIANTNDTDNCSIEYFIDVNLKGVKLDTEDIFKGYLFSQDSGTEIRTEWKNFKILSFKLNDRLKELRTEYPTIKLLEHYFYCSLYKNTNFKDIQFREDFTISKKVELDGVIHYTGEHLIKVLQDRSYMINSLKDINKFLNIIIDIIKSETPSSDFKDLFNPSANIDNDEVTIIHNFIGKIIRDSNVVPKILIMKYILEVLFSPANKSKDDYRKIYNIYLLAVLFTVFESDKNIKRVLPVIKDEEWYIKAVDQSKDYFSRNTIAKSRITAQYKIIEHEDEVDYMFRCKSLATIYNFFKINGNKVRIIPGKMSKLKEYVSNSERFSTEHLIINKNGSVELLGCRFNYPSGIKKYANSIFNFIFVSRRLNNELGDKTLKDKIKIIGEKLDGNAQAVECDYSEMVIEICKRHFHQILGPNNNEAEALKNFYQNDFIQVFADFALDIIKKIGDKLLVSSGS